MNDFNKDRTSFIGGSDIAAIMGLSRWNTPLSTWALKTNQYEDPFEMNEAVEMGIELEDFVAKKFEERSGKKVRKDNRDFTHPEYPYMKAHIDRWIVGGELLECKTCSAYKDGEWADDGVPDEYQLQVNWYLGIVGQHMGYIAVLIGGQKFVWKPLKFDKELFELQVTRARDFWENFVLTKTPPMAIGNDKDTLVGLFPESRPKTLGIVEGGDVELTFNDLAMSAIEGKVQKKALGEEIDVSENLLRQMIGDDEGLESGQYKATWKSQNSSSVDTEKLKEDGLYDAYVIRKRIRVLRIVEKKSKAK